MVSAFAAMGKQNTKQLVLTCVHGAGPVGHQTTLATHTRLIDDV